MIAMQRAGWICASMLLLHACLEPNPNAEMAGDEAADTTTETTGPPACVDIGDPDACAAAEGCQPVEGARHKQNGPDAPCLEPADFIGCIDEQACDDVVTWFCQGNGSYQVDDSCGPAGFAPCEAPADPIDACP
jgi:hypothetical protein